MALEAFTRQANPAAATLTALATVPADSLYLIAILTVANRSASPTSFRLALAPAGAADALTQYVARDLPIRGNDVYRTKLVLAPTDVIRVYATLATLTFTVNGLRVVA